MALLIALTCTVLMLTTAAVGFAQVSPQGAELPDVASPPEMARLVAAAGQKTGVPPIAPKRDVLIFIPGVLGSQLTDPRTGKVIWPSAASARDLALLGREDAEPAEAKIIDEYFVDIHGRMKVELAGLGNKVDILFFPYDWRQDIERIAGWLDAKLKGEWKELVQGARVTIVAHSLGAVVAWTWKNRYYNSDLELSKLVLLGAPLEGSCEILRALLRGYEEIPALEKSTSAASRALRELLMGSLRPAAYTFSSVFQLLPDSSDDPRTACLIVDKPQTGMSPADHFDPSIWNAHLLPLLTGSGVWRRYTIGFVGLYKKAVWEELGVTREKFQERLKTLLYRAERFRKSFDLTEGPLAASTKGSEGRVRYFFSKKHETPFQITIQDGQIQSAGTLKNFGDGRVLAHSAQNVGRNTSVPLELQSTHGDLIKDEVFINWLRADFRLLQRQVVINAIANIWKKDEVARRVLADIGKVVWLREYGVDPLQNQFEPGELALVEYNADVLRRHFAKGGVVVANPSREAQRIAAKLQTGGPDAKVALSVYETVIANRELSKEELAQATIDYSRVLIETNQARLAVAALKAKPDLVEAPGTSAYALNNLGVAYAKLGYLDEASTNYRKAAVLGLAVARSNLDRLAPVQLRVDMGQGEYAGVRIVSNPSAIDCPGVCVASMPKGTEVILSAVYAGSARKIRWSGCREANVFNCVVPLTDDVSVTIR